MSDDRAETILEEAQRIVHGRRQQDYGHPAVNHARTAALWIAYIEGKYGVALGLTAEDVCMLNILQKMGREMNRPTRDGLVDISGYAANVAMVRDEHERQVRALGLG